MEKEEEGYYFPKIDFNRCIECGLCEIVCPVLNDKSERSYTSTYYGASSKDTEIILNSSSGGMFSEILNAAYREESRKINVAGREVMRNVLFRSFLPIVGAEEAQCGINN